MTETRSQTPPSDLRQSPGAEEYDIIADTSAYARPSDELAEAAQEDDTAANLEALLNSLIKRRQFLAQDAAIYPVVYMTRAQDITALQTLIAGVREALADELSLRRSG